MLDQLEQLPADPILGLSAACRADPNPDKVDLTVGIYMDEQGICPVFEAIRQAQQDLVAEEATKAYMPPAGDEAFNRGMRRLVLGDDSPALADERVSSVQTPGGCGALRIGAEIIHAATPGARVWISDPTWPIHIPLVGSVGLQFRTYRYYDPSDHSVDFNGMVEDLKAAGAGDVVLLHGCCHNPCGADLDPGQWEVIAEMAERQGFTPFIDIAYQGLGDGLDQDAAGLRLMVDRLPEVIVAASCSKNMGLYRERTGAALFVCRDRRNADALTSHALTAHRHVVVRRHARGDIDLDLALLAYAPVAAARQAGIRHGRAGAAAAPARRHRHELAEQRALHLADLAGAAAVGTGGGAGSRLRAAAAARVARVHALQPDLLRDAFRDLLETELQADLEVLPLTGGPPPSAAEPEDVLHPAEVAHERAQGVGEIEVLEPEAGTPGPEAAVGGGVPEPVVARALVLVVEDLVGLRGLLELLLGLGISRIAVGVELQRLLPVGLLDLVGGRGLLDAEDLVVVALHAGSARATITFAGRSTFSPSR